MNLTAKTFLTITVLAALSASAFAKGKKPPPLIVPRRDVPAAVWATIESNAAGGKVTEVTKETINGILYYYGEVKGADRQWTKICVRETGELVKVEPDKARNKRKHKPLFG